MKPDVNPEQWSDIILAELKDLNAQFKGYDDRFKTLETLLMGVPNTDSKGLVGDVHDLFRSRNTQEDRIGRVEERCDAIHGKDPGGKTESGAFPVFDKAVLKWLILVATGGAFFGGVIVAFGDRFNWW